MPRSARFSVVVKYTSRRNRRSEGSIENEAHFDSIASRSPMNEQPLIPTEDALRSPPPTLHKYERGSRYRIAPKCTAVAMLLAEDDRKSQESAISPDAKEARQWDFIKQLDAYSLTTEADKSEE